MRKEKLDWIQKLQKPKDQTKTLKVNNLRKHYRYIVDKALEDCPEFMTKCPFDEISITHGVRNMEEDGFFAQYK
jgi:hypothetical protein